MNHDLQAAYERHLETFYSPSQLRDREGRWTRGGGGSVLDTTKRREARRAHLVKRGYPGEHVIASAESALEPLGEFWQDAKADGRMSVRVRVPAKAVPQIIKDGEIKTQHETGRSGGLFDPSTRHAHEEKMFGEPVRPIYGYVHVKGAHEHNEAVQYGEFGVVLKPEALNRSSLTLGDSLNMADPPAPLVIKELDTLGGKALGRAVYAAASDLSTAAAVAQIHTNELPSVTPPYVRTLTQVRYIEAQIVGGIKLSDIDHVVIPNVDRLRSGWDGATGRLDAFDAAVTALEASGVKLVYTDVEAGGDFSAIAAAARRQTAREWLGGTVEGLTTAQVDAALELACYDASCRPPTSGGTGGSLKTQAGYRGIHVYFTTSDVVEATRIYSGNATVADMGKILSDEDVGANWWTSSEGGSLDDAKTWANGIDDDPIDDLADEIATYDEAYIGMQLAITARLPAEFRHETSGDAWEHRVPNTDKLVIDTIDYSVNNGATWHTVKVDGKIVRKVTSGLGGRPDERGIRASAEELACHDATCAPPPVGTGGSRAGGPVHSIVQSGTTDARVTLAESLFNHELPLGYSSRIEKGSFDRGVLSQDRALYMEGVIRSPDDEVAGHFERSLKVRAGGELVVDHTTLVLDPKHQGMGIANAFIDQSITEYQKIGVSRVEVLAAMDVGAFAWARQGYRFPDTRDGEIERKQWVEGRLLHVKKLADEGTKYNWSREDATQMKKVAQELLNASNRGEKVQPIHIASLGEERYRYPAVSSSVDNHGRIVERDYTTWPGKEVLLNWNHSGVYGDPSWNGVKYLDGRDESVAASVETEEFYNPSQPRDKEGKWTVSAAPTNPDGSPRPNAGINVSNVKIRGYDNKEAVTAEAYKFHGPRHVADSMDPELRAKVTADLLSRKFSGGGDDLPGELDAYIRDLGFINGGTPPIGLALQAAHLYEALDDPGKVGWDYAKVDQIRDLISNYDNDVMRTHFVHSPEEATKLHDAIYKLTGIDATTGLIGGINRSWQVSASDTLSVAAHLMVAETHGLRDARRSMNTYLKDGRIAKAENITNQIGAANLKAVTDAMYTTTQRELTRLFDDQPITIYRGVEDTFAVSGRNRSYFVQPSPLSSWSTSADEASHFAGDRGVVMEINRLNKKDIFSLATITGTGSLDEQEVLLLGRKYDVDIYSGQRNLDAEDDYAATERTVIHIDNPAVSDPDWIKRIPKLRNRKSLTAALKASKLGATEIEEFYDPSQPRDKEGQWTRTGAFKQGSTYDRRPLSGDIREISIHGYKDEELQIAEAYKFHGPRHVADSMDPELRAKVTADLLGRSIASSSRLDDNGFNYLIDRVVDTGLLPQAGGWNLGLAMQVSHLYESVNNPESVGGNWNWKLSDQIRDVLGSETYSAQEKHDAIYKMTGVDATTGLIGAINRSWQVSASDTMSVAAHLTIEKTHDVSDGRETLATYMRGDRLEKADRLIAEVGESNMKAVTDAVYTTTQRELNRLFPDETLTIHRGVTTDASIGGSWVKPSPLSSWSTDSATASDFAGEDGWTMMIQHVPHENIYSLATITGMGSLEEQEVILIGHEQRVEIFGPNDYD